MTVSSYSTILFSFFFDFLLEGEAAGSFDLGGNGGSSPPGGGPGDDSFGGRGGRDMEGLQLGTGRGGRVLLGETVEEEGEGEGRCWVPITRGGREGLLGVKLFLTPPIPPPSLGGRGGLLLPDSFGGRGGWDLTGAESSLGGRGG